MADETSTKTNILLKALEHTQTNYRWLRDRSQTLFSWIGSLLLAIVGVTAALGPGKLATSGMYLQAGLTVAVTILFIFAWFSEVMIFKARVEELKSAAKIGRLLHFFEAGYFDEKTVIFDEEDWTHLIESKIRRWGISENTAVLFVLAIIVIVVVWTS